MILPQDITVEELMKTDYKYHYSPSELLKDYDRLCSITEYKKGSQFQPGMKLCKHFCPNFFDIQDANGKSFASEWKNEETMEAVLEWGRKSMSKLWMSWIRRAVYMVAGLPNSSFYRPHFSRQLIEMTGKDSGTLFDPCFGWGARMLGTTSKGWEYVGCDPNTQTYKNVCQMRDFLGVDATLLNIPAEKYRFETKHDLVLTSPPYFNLEVYTDKEGEDQCYAGHTYESWRDQWLVPLINSCLDNLSDDGLSAWNVMNFKKHDLVGDVIKAHEERGFELIDTLGFDSPLANIRSLKNKDITYIFRRVF